MIVFKVHCYQLQPLCRVIDIKNVFILTRSEPYHRLIFLILFCLFLFI